MENFFSFNQPYVPIQYYDNIRNYKYSSSDASITYKYIMSPLCNFLVTRFPIWLAPNVITISGFFLNIVYFIVENYYTKFKGGYIPSWACYFCAFCYLLYQILDNIDGKQARRTNSSSALGLLVDHGTDSCTTFFITCCLGAILALMTIHQYILLWIMIIVPFYLNNWEQYITGKMDLPLINGINEGTYIIVFLEVLSGIKGQNFLIETNLSIFGFNVQLNTFMCFIACWAGIFFGVLSVIKVILYQNRDIVISALIDIFPFIFFLLTFASVVYLTDSYFVSEYPQFVIVAFGFQFAKILGILQLAHLTKCRYNPYTFTFVIPNLTLIIHSIIYYTRNENKIFNLNVDNLIFIYFVLNFFIWLHFAYFCSEELCNILNINRFSLKKNIGEKKYESLKELEEKEKSDNFGL